MTTTATLPERDIIFTTENVRAIMEDAKTQTRRLDSPMVRAKYAVGRPLWVRETYCLGDGMNPTNDPAQPTFKADWPEVEHRRWKSPYAMTRALSRISLLVTGFRVEQLHAITEEDSRAEGIREVTKDGNVKKYCVYDLGRDLSSTPWQDMARTARDAYRGLWDKINLKRGYPWEKNPMVAVITFKVVSAKGKGY